ncbi:glucose-6-phosphate dehydrogenase [Hyphococcus luteus]|uniref:Glucose-6-phosphate 1-dehydrogenase n=1 Tax=Hyphococcus luteus TaxID=2058213 RepID=A0A2S7K9V7_9PROT|nr:glucose-6-phosphate dehydrogenase [Marinicaulis flavus]PQA89300.1 glucose-6-phosphate dehydrogenase [Marinicaulis flavus]
MVKSPYSPHFIPVTAFDLVVFGAAGDLSLRKLIPALFHRWRDNQIPAESKIVGVSRTAMDDDAFRKLAIESFRKFHPDEIIDDSEWAAFASQLYYAELDAVKEGGEGWARLKDLLSGGEDKQRVFYLALAPGLYGAVSANIDAAGLKSPGARIVLEKPIGTDLQSAHAINEAVGAVFEEESIFRIDHYLGKETVQNLIVLRFMNSLFEPVWNANAIDHIEITVAESIGAGGRASYYDKAGALRDMVQNHLLQLLCLVAMEPPLDLSPDTLRDEKIKVLRALRPITKDNARQTTVRGQYGKGAADSEVAPGYAEELGAESTTETFVAIKANIDNWRWKGMPIYLRTGKRMKDRRSEIIIQFKEVAHALINDGGPLPPTRMVIRLQPDEGVRLLLVTKDPGPGGMRLRYVPLNLSYADAFKARYPDAYERLLMAVVRGDLALFMRRDEVEAAWRWVDGILEAWEADGTPAYAYAAGTEGPAQAAMMLDRDGREWFEGV